MVCTKTIRPILLIKNKMRVFTSLNFTLCFTRGTVFINRHFRHACYCTSMLVWKKRTEKISFIKLYFFGFIILLNSKERKFHSLDCFAFFGFKVSHAKMYFWRNLWLYKKNFEKLLLDFKMKVVYHKITTCCDFSFHNIFSIELNVFFLLWNLFPGKENQIIMSFAQKNWNNKTIRWWWWLSFVFYLYTRILYRAITVMMCIFWDYYCKFRPSTCYFLGNVPIIFYGGSLILFFKKMESNNAITFGSFFYFLCHIIIIPLSFCIVILNYKTDLFLLLVTCCTHDKRKHYYMLSFYYCSNMFSTSRRNLQILLCYVRLIPSQCFNH